MVRRSRKASPSQNPLPVRKRPRADVERLSPEARLHLVAWDSYIRPAFFSRLLKSRNDRDRLKRIVQGYRLGERQLDSLQRRLRAERVHIKLKHIVLSLHSYTLPKRTRRSIIGELQNGAPAKPWNLW